MHDAFERKFETEMMRQKQEDKGHGGSQNVEAVPRCAGAPGSVRCADCERGDEPMLLDRDGVKCSISGNEGTWCHAYDIYWWPCSDKEGAPNDGDMARLPAQHNSEGKAL